MGFTYTTHFSLAKPAAGQTPWHEEMNANLDAIDAALAAAGGSGYQPLDADLTAIAALAGTSGVLRKTAANTWTLDTTGYASASHTHELGSIYNYEGTAGAVYLDQDGNLVDDVALPIAVGGTGASTAAEALTALGGAASSHTHTGTYQPLDATLTALAGVTTAADTLLYATAADTFSTTPLTSAARTLLDDATVGNMRTTLGLVIGTNVQAYDADLAAIAALTGSTGLLKKTAEATWTIDTTAYGTGTVTSVTAGAGLTQSGTSTINPTLDVVSHAGTAGSVGTLTVSADSVGVTLGTTGTTACSGADYRLSNARTPTAHTQALTTITTAITAGTLLKSDGTNPVASAVTEAIVAANTAKVSFPGFGTTVSTAAYGNHTHTGVYAEASHTHESSTIYTSESTTGVAVFDVQGWLTYAQAIPVELGGTGATSAAGALAALGAASASHTHTGTYAAYSAKLAAIAALANSAGVLTNDGLGNFSYSASSGSGAITPSSVACSGDGTFSGVLYAGYNIAGAYPSTGSPYGLAIARNFSGSAAEVNFFNCATSGSGFDFRQMTGSAASTPAAVSMGALTATSGTFSGALTGSGAGLTNIPLSALDADLAAIGAITETTGLLRKTAANTWTLDTTAYGTGTVTTLSVATANGFAGTVATATTTPAITLTTSVTGLLKGNGTAISAAVSGTDYQAPVVLWVKTTATTLSAWTTATSITGGAGTGVGTLTIPANRLVAGSRLRIKLMGVLGTGTAAPTLNLALTLGGVAVCSTGAVTLTTVSMSNRYWEAEFMVTCRTAGATGTVIGHGYFSWNTTGNTTLETGMPATATATVNTTGTLVIGVTAACGTSDALNTMTCHQCMVEIL